MKRLDAVCIVRSDWICWGIRARRESKELVGIAFGGSDIDPAPYCRYITIVQDLCGLLRRIEKRLEVAPWESSFDILMARLREKEVPRHEHVVVFLEL